VSAGKSLQETYAPENRCFGCGPKNDKGLRIRSFVADDGNSVVCTWQPEEHHQAFGGVLNGGIIGALLDCHSNWTAAYQLMKARGDAALPCTVTADFHVKLRRPTPLGGPVSLRAWVERIEGDQAIVEATLEAGGKVTATCRGTFVAVKEGHPAFHRW
jgi:acyl-coenzyme A thioesterase PaaI-like protein